MNLKNLLTNFFQKPQPKEVVEKKWEVEEDKRTWKFSEEQKQEIVACIARGMTPGEVDDAIFEEHGTHVTKEAYYQYKRGAKWQPLVKKLRDEYEKDLSRIAGAKKSVRLERRDRIYEKAMKKGDLRVALSATDSQKVEMEEKNQAGINLIFQQYNTLSNEEIEEKKKELLEKIKNTQAITIKPVEENGNSQ